MNRGDVLAALAAFPARLATAGVAAVAGVAAAQRSVRAGEWGPQEVVRHLIAVETDVHQARLADLEAHEAPVWDWTEPGPWLGEPDLTLDALLERFRALRATTLDTVAALDDAGWARSGTHTTMGVLDVRGILVNAVDHDEQHLAGLA